MKTIKSSIAYKKRASRLELLVRIVYMIPIIVVLWIFNIMAGLAVFLQVFNILIFGQRNRTLNDFVKTYVTYMFRIRTYLSLLTDERPPIIPEKS